MTTREDVTITAFGVEISAVVLVEDGEAFDLDDVTLTSPGTHDIKLKIGDLTNATIRKIYKAAEDQYAAFMEAE